MRLERDEEISNERGLATLLIDLLTKDDERVDTETAHFDSTSVYLHVGSTAQEDGHERTNRQPI